MTSVIILGTGNVGRHLIKAFYKTENVELKQVYSRKKASLEFLKNTVDSCSELRDLKNADLYIIAISDDAISEFSSKLELKGKLVVHTSGTAPLQALKHKGRKGVFYPLQTFSKDMDVNFLSVPICIEAEQEKDRELIEGVAASISKSIYYINSKQRKYMHIAAVFSNNFVNHMYQLSADICGEQEIPFEILYPLILETAEKATLAYPGKNQTGPAFRGDKKTVLSELELLKGNKKIMYELLSQSIQKTHGEKL